MLGAHKATDQPKPGIPGLGPRVALASALCHAAVFLLAGLMPAVTTPPVPHVPMVVELVFEDDTAVTATGPVTPDQERLPKDAADDNPLPPMAEEDVPRAEPESVTEPDPVVPEFDDRLPVAALGTLTVRAKPKPPVPETAAAKQSVTDVVPKPVKKPPDKPLAALDARPTDRPRQKPGSGQAGADRISAVAMTGNPQPVYPRRAVRQSIEGTVHLSVLVAASGRAVQIEIAQSSGHNILDRVAVETVYRWHFRPAMSGGHPVEGRVNLPIVFRLLR